MPCGSRKRIGRLLRKETFHNVQGLHGYVPWAWAPGGYVYFDPRWWENALCTPKEERRSLYILR